MGAETDLHFGDYRLSRARRQLVGPLGPVALSARSFDILQLLLERQPDPVSKDDLLNRVWPGVAVEENTLQVHISALRKALPPDTIVTVHGRGYKYAGPEPSAPGGSGPVAGRSTAKVAEKPVVAVLPFTNLNQDPDQQFFSDGITDGLVDRLSRFRMVSVIDGQGADPARLRETLAANYVVTGTVRKAGERVRISARLTRAMDDTAIWAQHYDRPLTDIFALQDEVTSLIASTLVGRVEFEAVTRAPADPASLGSYELSMKGYWFFKRLTPEDYEKAAACFRQAIAEHPGNADAHRGLALYENNKWLFDFDWEGLERSRLHALKAIELDPANAICHAALGFCRMWLDGVEAAAENYDNAQALNPEDTHVLADVALLQCYRGDTVAARRALAEAFRLNPLPPIWFSEFRALADFLDGDYARALPAFLAVPEGAWDTMYALACFGLLGDRAGASRLLKGMPDRGRAWNFHRAAGREPFRGPEGRERLISGLAMALEA